MNILLLIVGLALIVGGANFLTEGASGIAKRMRVSEFVIGLTIVGFGTSMPELVVSLFAAIKGHSEMAIGNVVGSNMFNTMVILGITAMIRSVEFSKNNLTRDLPFAALASVVLVVMGCDVLTGSGEADVITRGEGMVLLCFFAVFMVYTFLTGHDEEASYREALEEGAEAVEEKRKHVWLLVLMVVAGLAGLIFGGEMFIGSATKLALSLGVSESVIAVTLVAGGTSLPELATSVVAMIKGKGDLALGNIVGSNIFNIFLILGVSATVSPLTMGDIMPADLFALLGSSLMMFVFAASFRRRAMDKPEGIISLLVYAAYVWWVVVR
ncbi:MAG: calcium/sodium antiporter [Alistipes sp.]|jgi:cation:H+ antiporter|nr:calcium/sodium antiporter [Alistipes sp.]